MCGGGGNPIKAIEQKVKDPVKTISMDFGTMKNDLNKGFQLNKQAAKDPSSKNLLARDSNTFQQVQRSDAAVNWMDPLAQQRSTDLLKADKKVMEMVNPPKPKPVAEEPSGAQVVNAKQQGNTAYSSSSLYAEGTLPGSINTENYKR